MRGIDELVTAIQKGVDNPATVGIMIPQEDSEKILEALKKQKPMLVTEAFKSGYLNHTNLEPICPLCENRLGITTFEMMNGKRKPKYCSSCGQAVKWE